MARDLAIQGTRAFEAEHWALALDHFDRALALFPAPSIAIMKARCLVRLERLVEALTRYEEIQRMTVSADASRPFRDAIADAKIEAEQLRSTMPRVRISVRAPTGQAEGLVVQLDGKLLPAVLVGVESPIDPGVHDIVATAPGYRLETKRVTVAAGQHLDVAFLLTEARPTAQPDPSPPADGSNQQPTNESGASRSLPVWGWTAIGVGVVALSVSAITGVMALEKKSSLDEACTPACPAHLADTLASFRNNRSWSYASLGVGAGSLAFGSYLLWRNASDTPQIVARVGPGTIAIHGAF